MIKLEKKIEMNREMVEKIYKNSVSDSIDNALDDDNETQAWLWEENMVKNSILELKYALSINHHALSLDQLAIIKDVFGDIV